MSRRFSHLKKNVMVVFTLEDRMSRWFSHLKMNVKGFSHLKMNVKVVSTLEDECHGSFHT